MHDEGTSVTTQSSWTAVTLQPVLKEMDARSAQPQPHPGMKRDSDVNYLLKISAQCTFKNSVKKIQLE